VAKEEEQRGTLDRVYVEWQKTKDEIAGTWKEAKLDFLEGADSPKALEVMQAILSEYEQIKNYQEEDLITVEQLFDTLDYILKASQTTYKDQLEDKAGFISIPNSRLYYNFREKIAQGSYIIEPGQWPEADISGGGVIGKTMIKPDISPVIKDEVLAELQEAMKNKVLDLSKHGDLAADVFDIITAKWLKEAKHYEAMIDITADEILQARGIKQQKSGSGRRGGYKDEWREGIQQQIENLSYQWITIKEIEVYRVEEGKKKAKPVKIRDEGRALTMERRMGQVKLDGSLDAYAWRLRPGAVFNNYLFGPGRQTALLSQRALNYNHYKQRLEKRLVRYLAWIWRIDEGRTREGLLVRTLLDKTGEEMNISRPGRTKNKLEKALDCLKDNGDITAWEYENIDKKLTTRRGWWKQWLELKIIITAPKNILEHYKQIEKPKGKQVKK